MKNSILKLSLGLIILSLVSCTKEGRIKGSGNVISENRVVNPFTGIESSGSNEVNINYGTAQKVEIIADDNVINHVRTRIHNSTLIIEMDDDYNYRKFSLTVNITIPVLSSIKNSGSGEFDVFGFDGLNSLSIKNSGSGEIKLDGSSTDLTIKNSGSGEVNGFSFNTKNCYITNSGSGLFEVSCTDRLEGKNSGSGAIYYKGYPSISVSNSGSGSVIDAN